MRMAAAKWMIPSLGRRQPVRFDVYIRSIYHIYNSTIISSSSWAVVRDQKLDLVLDSALGNLDRSDQVSVQYSVTCTVTDLVTKYNPSYRLVTGCCNPAWSYSSSISYSRVQQSKMHGGNNHVIFCILSTFFCTFPSSYAASLRYHITSVYNCNRFSVYLLAQTY
jgi:hypothetical protein